MVFILVFIYIYPCHLGDTCSELGATGAKGTNIVRFDKSSSLMELRGRK